MQIDVKQGRGRVAVGPPGGPTMKIPTACTIEVTDIEPYEVDVRMEWIPEEGRLGTRRATYSALPQGESVRLANINKIALGELLHRALETAVLGSGGWAGVVEYADGYDQMQVDALVYLLAVALDSPKPSATVALARGMSPASGPKRVANARKAGLIPETEPGKASGA
ncbi:MAG: hypothetical protein QNM02_16990 [Acidimicrobiia bacterium]|nr:hypothetical protein [Acidimicrobiia bacterium]